MKKIFILTGEPSGDMLASKVIKQLKILRSDVEYLSVGGEYLNSLGIKSIFDLKKITYLGFTKVLLNIFEIKKKINETVEKIVEFNPDILFSVDSPDFTLRVVERVKKINSNIKTIHYVAPQVWVWREHRVKKLKNFLDHILLLFPFEKQYFEKESITCTFVGHPLLDDNNKNNIDIKNVFKKDKKIISMFSGSRISEINILTPILLKFAKIMQEKYNNIHFIFHTTNEHRDTIKKKVSKENIINCDVISDTKIKSYILKKSTFAVAKSGTISLEICNANIPSIIIYKINFINFFIVKMLAKVKFANIINIAAGKEIIPELLQEKCKAINIFNKVDEYFNNPDLSVNQVSQVKEIIKDFKTGKSSNLTSSILNNSL